MSNQILGNYLKIHRRKCGLSQRELGRLVGYTDESQIQRQEDNQATPPLLIAIAFEVLFQTSVSAIFVGFQSAVAHAIEANVAEFAKDLEARANGRRLSGRELRKRQWLTDRHAR